MQADFGSCLDVGPERIGVQQQDQLRTLVELVGRRPLAHDLASLLHELGWEDRLIVRHGAWHGHPSSGGLDLRRPPSAPSTLPATLSQPYRQF